MHVPTPALFQCIHTVLLMNGVNLSHQCLILDDSSFDHPTQIHPPTEYEQKHAGLAECIRFLCLIQRLRSRAAAKCWVCPCATAHTACPDEPLPQNWDIFALYVWLHYTMHHPPSFSSRLKEKQVPGVGAGVESRPFPHVYGMLLMRWGNGFPPTALTCTLRIN